MSFWGTQDKRGKQQKSFSEIKSLCECSTGWRPWRNKPETLLEKLGSAQMENWTGKALTKNYQEKMENCRRREIQSQTFFCLSFWLLNFGKALFSQSPQRFCFCNFRCKHNTNLYFRPLKFFLLMLSRRSIATLKTTHAPYAWKTKQQQYRDANPLRY